MTSSGAASAAGDGTPDALAVAVVGAGAMGAGIAQVAAMAGHPVLLHDARADAAEAAVAGIREQLRKLVRKGRMDADAGVAAAARLGTASSLSGLSRCGLVVEAILEDLNAKRALFARIEEVVAEKAVLATNTSSLSVTAIGAALRHPGRMVGMHFFNPAPLMPLVEVVSGAATVPAVAEWVHALAGRWGKTPVHARSTPGFIVNRVARPYYAEALRLLQEGAADPATLDAVMRDCGGFRMGPFELMDMIGHDVNYAVTRSVFDAYYGDPRFQPSLIQLELVNAGFLGRKSGRGFYDYEAGGETPRAAEEPPRRCPARIQLCTDSYLGRSLAQRLAARGIEVKPIPGIRADGAAVAIAGEARLYLTDGRTATERAAVDGIDNVVLIDLMLDPAQAGRVTVSRATQCDGEAWDSAVGLLQAAGFVVTALADAPGLVVMRTVAMLANEACDAVHQRVCTSADVNLAMRAGVAYPLGPLEWAERAGLDLFLSVLDHLARYYGDPRYRASPRLRQRQWTGRGLYG